MAFRRRVAEGEVDKVVLMDNMSKAYIAMKEGFPDEYVVDLPMDPYLPQFLDSFPVSCSFVMFLGFYRSPFHIQILGMKLLMLLRNVTAVRW
jgi:hypothetical protein